MISECPISFHEQTVQTCPVERPSVLSRGSLSKDYNNTVLDTTIVSV